MRSRILLCKTLTKDFVSDDIFLPMPPFRYKISETAARIYDIIRAEEKSIAFDEFTEFSKFFTSSLLH